MFCKERGTPHDPDGAATDRREAATAHLGWRDGSYNLVPAWREYGREVGIHFGPTDLVALARSFGATGLRVNDADELRSTLPHALALRSPAVIEIPVDYRGNPPLEQPMRMHTID
jgi:acetolactate synthase-1/2/3 large subunit